MNKLINYFSIFLVAVSVSLFSCDNVGDDLIALPEYPETPDIPVDLGEGTQESPYTVQWVLKQSTKDTIKGVWVKGYIVGAINGISIGDSIFNVDEITTNLNLLLAPEKRETAQTAAIPVALSVGTVRDKLNLLDNKGNIGAQLSMQCDVLKYFGVIGIKNIVAETITLDGAPVNPDEPVDPETPEISVSGDASKAVSALNYDFGDVTSNVDFAKEEWQNVKISGDRKWQGKEDTKTGNKYIQATAHNASEASRHESWVITPGLNLDAAAEKVFSFKSAMAYWNDDTVFDIYVLQNQEGKTVKTKITASATLPTSASQIYTFVSSGNIDLSAYSGIVYIGFHYSGAGGSSKSTTWQIDDFVFAGEAAPDQTSVSITYGKSSVNVGEEFLCEITTNVTNGEGATQITATGLPAWAKFTDNGNGTASIAGTAPAEEEASEVTLTATNNGVSATKTFTLKVVTPSTPGTPGESLIANGSFEDWTDAAPNGWTLKTVSGVTYSKENAIVNEGSNAIKVESGANAGTAAITPTRIMMEPGTYTWSFDYYLDPAVTAEKTFRPWGMTYDDMTTGGQSTDVDFNDMKGLLQPTTYVAVDKKGEWVKHTITFTVPKTCYVVFDLRFYKGTTGYLDNVELVKN